MRELDTDRELRKALMRLKAAEYKMIEDENLNKIENIFAIRSVVLRGSYNMSEVLEFIKSVYMKENNAE